MTRDKHTKIDLGFDDYLDDETMFDPGWLDDQPTLEYTVPPELLAAASQTLEIDEEQGTIVRPVPPPPIQKWRKP